MWQGNQIKHVWQILGLKGAAATEWGLPEILSGQNLLNYKNQYHGAKTRTRNPYVPGFVITSQDLLASCAASVGLIFLIIRWNTRQKYPFSPHFLPALNSRTSYFIPTSRFLKISYMFIWILPFPAIMLVVQHLSLCNLNGHMRIQLPHLIRREILNLLKMTRYSFQRHCFIYAFPRHGSPANVGSKVWSCFFLHLLFSLFPKVDLKRIKHPVYPRINHHKYCAYRICWDMSNTHSGILKSINETLGNALRPRTNEYTHFTKQYRATSTGTSLGYQSKKIIREKTNNIQSSVTQPHMAWLKFMVRWGMGWEHVILTRSFCYTGNFYVAQKTLTSVLWHWRGTLLITLYYLKFYEIRNKCV